MLVESHLWCQGQAKEEKNKGDGKTQVGQSPYLSLAESQFPIPLIGRESVPCISHWLRVSPLYLLLAEIPVPCTSHWQRVSPLYLSLAESPVPRTSHWLRVSPSYLSLADSQSPVPLIG